MDASVQNGQRQTLQQIIYEQLRDEIVSGALAPGEQLREAHLATRFGTSQAPVREALRRLCEEGLATSFPYRGVFTKRLSWSEVEDIYGLREELEAWAVRRILSRGRLDIGPLQRALRDIERAVKTGSSQAALNADMAFHEALCTEAESKLLLETWASVVKQFRGLRVVLSKGRPDDLSTLVATHRSIIEALETRDAEVAERCIRDHLRAAVVDWKVLYDSAMPGE